MPEYLKKLNSNNAKVQETSNVSEIVKNILLDIEKGGEKKVLDYCVKFDKWTMDNNVVLTQKQIDDAIAKVPLQIKKDIQFAHGNIKLFAEYQRSAIQDFQFETSPGYFVGQKLIPLNTAGCYVPGGRYSHVASALMTVTTAKVAGCKKIYVCTPRFDNKDVNPAIIYAAVLSGADKILQIGGVQAIASMANGYFGMEKADIIVGPGNHFVAEAKQQLYGKLGIDLLAGPTDELIVADSTADPQMVAVDLVGQAEHGWNSPVWLVTDDRNLALKVMEIIPHLIDDLPKLNGDNARSAWRDFGEVIVCSDRNEMLKYANLYAAEHLHVVAKDLEWWKQNLTAYGSLFLGEETCVSYGDKASGPNHTLPTNRSANYTGGLSIHKFLKIVTWQQCTRESSQQVAEVTARISRFEGMEGHARQADIRLKKYWPNKKFMFEAKL